MKRKVLFKDGMCSDCLLVITDTPKEIIEKWLRDYNETMFDVLNALEEEYDTRILFNSDVNIDIDEVEIIGYDEIYDICDYMEEV